MVEAPEKIWVHPKEQTHWTTIPPENNTMVQFVRADIAERQIAELRAELKTSTDSREFWKKAAEEENAKLEALAAENARLRALPLKEEVELVLNKVRQFIENGVEFGYIRLPNPPDPALDTLPAIIALLSRLRAGEQEGWREITEDDQPPLDTDVIMGCWETLPKRHWATEIGHYGSKRGGWIRGWITHWLPLDRLPAAPSEQGGDRG